MYFVNLCMLQRRESNKGNVLINSIICTNSTPLLADRTTTDFLSNDPCVYYNYMQLDGAGGQIIITFLSDQLCSLIICIAVYMPGDKFLM